MPDRDRAFKDAIYEQIARVGRAVDHPRRLELLDLLCQGPMTVEQLVAKSAMPMGSASQHLQHLRETRLVRAERRGSYMVYQLADETVCSFFLALRTLAENRYAEIRSITEAFLHDREALEAMDTATLRDRMSTEPVVLLDVRPPEEYANGHWPGAWSVPLNGLADRLADLPQDQTIVAYCRGPYCVLALHAVELLRERGFHAVRLTDGVGEWRARGDMVAQGAES